MGNSIIRVLFGALVAIPVAVGLFLVMQSLIDKDYEQIMGRSDYHPDVPERLEKLQESKAELEATMIMQAQVRNYMAVECHSVDNATNLAENAAWHFNRSEWLDDDTHWVWDLAAEFISADY